MVRVVDDEPVLQVRLPHGCSNAVGGDELVSSSFTERLEQGVTREGVERAPVPADFVVQFCTLPVGELLLAFRVPRRLELGKLSCLQRSPHCSGMHSAPTTGFTPRHRIAVMMAAFGS